MRECLDEFGGLVWSLTRRMGFSSAEAEDAVQEIFIEVWKNAKKYDPGIASEATFVAMIARRRLIDRKRRTGRQAPGVEIESALASDVSVGSWRGAGASADAPGSSAEEVAKAARALDQLAPDQQKVLRLSIYRGLSHELISRALDMPLGTVKTHARRGLIRVRELLSGGDRRLSESKPPSGTGIGPVATKGGVS